MKKLLLLLTLSCLSLVGYSQTAASYSFTYFTAPYTSISSTGTATTTISGDDLGQCDIPIGFSFTYCGSSYTTIAANSNGYLSLINNCVGGYPTYVNATSSYTYSSSLMGGGVGMLMAYWDDLHGGGHTAYYSTTGTAPNRVFTFEWNNWHTFSASGNANFQIKLYETSNVIDFCYGGSTYSGLSATCGIANSATDWQTLPDVSSSPVPSSTTFTTSLNTSPSSGQVYRWSYQCTGRPTAGTVAASPTFGCASYTTTLSLAGASAGGVAYQWQTSSDSLSWTTVSGATNATYTASVTGNVYYRMVILCVATGLYDTSAGRLLPLYTPPASITGPTSVCQGSTITLADATTGGTWTSGTTSVATVGSTTGVVTGVSPGTTSISYTMPTGCRSTYTVTVYLTPAGISGTTSVCEGATTTLSSSTTGGTWSSSATGTATVGSTTGVVTGVTAGTAVISYTLASGCFRTATVTVNPSPSPITGTMAVCEGSTTTLSSTTSGGTWSSSATFYATVGSSTGVVTGVLAGTSIITYTMPGGCYRTATVTVNPLPPGITGTTTICIGQTATLSSGSGGTWTSSNPSVATIGSTTGLLTGISTGTAVITYTLPTGCRTSTTVNVNPVPLPISGTRNVCEGLTTTLTDASGGGTWSSSDASIASVSSSGVVTGMSAGVCTISYSFSTGCSATVTFTVNPLPAPITGFSTLCVGMTTTMIDGSGGGTWSSSNPSIATIGSTTGVVTGIASGSATITYTLPTGCIATVGMTIFPNPAPISGATSVCVGGTTTLTDGTSGGGWTSSSTSIATVGYTTGLVTGISAGTVVISYTLASTGCFRTTTLTVNAAPPGITGSTRVCVGGTTTLSDAVTGGTWISSATSVATVGSTTGVVSGVALGIARITYTAPTGCFTYVTVTVNPSPAAITGTMTVCEGSTTTLSDATTGGTWSSGATSIATVGSTTGVVTGVSTGTATITYTASTGCTATTVVTVTPLPSGISGTMYACIGGTSTLTSSTSGGTWSISPTTIATIGSTTGVVTGVSAGTATVTYSLGGTCRTTATFTVAPNPAAISGPASMCPGASVTLTSATTGGTWSSSSSNITIGSTTGVATGVTVGTAIITYTSSLGCITTRTETVSPLPGAISGATGLCVGATSTLTSSTSGGTWTSSSTGVATIGSTSGVVTAIATGSTIITYTAPTGCTTTTTVNVNTSPGPILGSSTVCNGASTTMSNSVSGGIWSTSSGTITIGSTSGIVTGVTTGPATITYSLGSGCTVTKTMTVLAAPAPIAGAGAVCLGSTLTLTDATSGGIWTSSATGVATVGSTTGVVTPVSSGTAIINYTLSSGCSAIATVTVSPSPTAIAGPSTVCAGSTITLTDGVSGGVWTSSNPAVATVGSTTGVVSGVASGTATITYSVGCFVTKTVTVSPIAPITGASALCVGSTITLSDAATGGIWTSSNPGVATIGSTTGIVTGITTGTTNITYTVGSGCNAITTITVSLSPSAILGPSSVCTGTTITLTNMVGGGIWSSSASGIASVGSSSGIVTGVSAGSATITYSLGSGCTVTKTVNVSPIGPITGASAICVGSTMTLSDSVSGGIWTSGSPGVATVGSTTGIVTGISTGTANITYSIGSGCSAVTTVTVSLSPSAISGPSSVCEGATITLTNSVGGGIWSSSSSSVATVGSSSGVVTGVGAGTTTISYSLGSGCIVTKTIGVSPISPIVGGGAVCVGSTLTLTNATTGGLWTSGATGVATVGSTSGIVTGVSTGTATITYSIGSGCSVVTTVTVSLSPSAIAGPSSVCEGSTITLTNTVGGGIWSSSASTVASVGSSTGVVTGMGAGTATITYSLGSGCTVTKLVSVNPISPITGASAICVGTTMTLSDATSGGSWSSSATSVATVSATTGVVTGVSTGTANITYLMPSGCYAVTTVTVSLSPSAISGPSSVCQGSTVTFTDAVGGGIWSSSASSIASVGSSSGVVSGIGAGTATITYSLGSGCTVTKSITVNPMGAITGATTVCVGATTTLSNSVTGGTWTSGATGVATVGASTGIVTGVSAGSAVITYALASGCTATTTVNVSLSPSAISGPSNVCRGSDITLTDAVTGGLWSTASSNATVGSLSGIVTGVNAGSATITYSLGSGCSVTKTITVNPTAPITGGTALCMGLTSTLSNAVPGGVWTSGTTSVATIGASTGVVTGVSAGTSVITYTTTAGCAMTTTITVNSLPAPIGGPTTICVGTSGTLTNATSGGTWTSSNPAVATIGASTGVVNGISLGTSNITYSLGSGCTATTVVTVSSLPAPISGPSGVCLGSTITLTDAGTGTWSSSNTAVATVGSTTGVVTGVSLGAATITYSLGTGCVTTKTITVNPLPGPSTGGAPICVGQTTTLANSGGGTWSSSNPSIGTVGATTGVVTGTGAGTVIITYTLPTGCITTSSVLVNARPSDIIGPGEVCAGSSITLVDTTAGGAWSSSDPTVAAVSGTGVVTGIASGTVAISYTYTSGMGCGVIKSVIVDPVAPITGPNHVCVGQTITLSDTALGGTWTSSNPSIATVTTAGSGTGIVRGMTAGSVVITYHLPTGCLATTTVTVDPGPAAITGTPQVCVGQVTILSSTTTGGTWSSSNPGVASVGATGSVLGVTAGTATISYITGGCPATITVTVNPLPNPISGIMNVCVGQTTTLTDAGGGTWSAPSYTAIATVGLTSGVVTGISAGDAAITYTLPTGCTTTATVTVNPLPDSIVGMTDVCVGQTTTLTDPVSGGTWASSNPSVATIGMTTGVVTGIASGTSIITYTIGTGCSITTTVTVHALPPAISGPSNVCEGGTITLTSSGTGTWSVASIAIATVGSTTGVVTGVSAGFTTVTFSLGTGCSSTKDITVNPAPSPITGSMGVCVGQTTMLADATMGGTWSSSSPTIASINAVTGDVTGNSAGVAVISYVLSSTGCAATATFTVNPLPSVIMGPSNVCLGSTQLLTDSIPGGTWVSSNTAVATIGSTSGIVAGIAIGSSTITYTLAAGCLTTKPINVVPLPGLYTITGGGNFCAGGVGVHVGLSGSAVGVNYFLYRAGSVATGPIAGTGSALDFGLQTVAGSYTVIAVSGATSCSRTMTGTAVIIVNPSVTPSVAITTGIGDTVCAGTVTTFTPIPTNGGSSPTYVWNINGYDVATSGTYSYTPANGDLVKVTMTSNAGCAVPATASTTITMTVWAQELPAVSVTVSPKDTICLGNAAIFTAVPEYGGATPTFTWMLNGSPAHTGPTYMMAPSNGDVISVVMNSTFPCRLANTAASNPITMTVVEPVLPLVEIRGSAGLSINRGQTDTLHAVILNSVTNPTYQWLINGIPVVGATTSTYVSNEFSYPNADSVTCKVTDNSECGMTGFGWAYITVGTTGVQPIGGGSSEISVLPNPNKGEFTIKGNMGSANGDVSLELTDMLGQVVYREKVAIANGKINKHVKLNSLANGMYLLSVRSEADDKVFHIVVEQ